MSLYFSYPNQSLAQGQVYYYDSGYMGNYPNRSYQGYGIDYQGNVYNSQVLAPRIGQDFYTNSASYYGNNYKNNSVYQRRSRQTNRRIYNNPNQPSSNQAQGINSN